MVGTSFLPTTQKVRIFMNMLLIVCLLFSGFNLRWNIPYGTIAPGGKLLIYDSDHDGEIELIFRRWIVGSVGVYFVEFVPPDSWDIYESTTIDSVLVWDVGDLDVDGYTDLVTYGNASESPLIPIISVYESPDSSSYPASEVWRDSVGFALVQPISSYDVDKDSTPEIFKLGWRKDTTYYPFGVYECTGNNQYDTVFMGTGLGSLSSTMAFADFDGDSVIEFIIGNVDGRYQIWECSGNNNYQLINQQQLPTANITDCFSVLDADGDGKMEFILKGVRILSELIDAFIFEATSDNTYEIVDTLILPAGDYYGGYSAAGDVDGDSVPEIVLEARQNVFIIKASGNDSFYVWDTLPGNDAGSSVAIYDIDGNGYQEIVISGNDETRIYEYDFGIEEYNTSTSKTDYPFATIFRGPLLLPEGKECKVFDITGRTVSPDKIKPGIYFIEIEGEIIGKVVKIR